MGNTTSMKTHKNGAHKHGDVTCTMKHGRRGAFRHGRRGAFRHGRSHKKHYRRSRRGGTSPLNPNASASAVASSSSNSSTRKKSKSKRNVGPSLLKHVLKKSFKLAKVKSGKRDYKVEETVEPVLEAIQSIQAPVQSIRKKRRKSV